MAEEEKTNDLITQDSSLPIEAGMAELNAESKALLSKIISETNPDKAKDLTHLFNLNQNKKTLARVDKLSELMDAITDQALARFTQRPDEISNQELLQSLKTVSDLIDKGQKTTTESEAQPFIQINQQNNEVNVNAETTPTSGLGRDSRERVKNAVMALLGQIQQAQKTPETPPIVDVEAVEEISEEISEETDSDDE